MKVTRLALFAVAFALTATGAVAKPKHKRFGFQGFGARYRGGYSIVEGDVSLAGPADIRIRAAKNGRTARVQWANTFYTTQGSYRIVLRWNFLSDGTAVMNSVDPEASGPGGSGTFTLDRNRPIPFSASAGSLRAEGVMHLIGGGALSITMTLTGLPGGDVTYSFSGGRSG